MDVWLRSLGYTDAIAALMIAIAGYCARFVIERRRDRDLEKFKHLLDQSGAAHSRLLEQRAEAIKVVYTGLTTYMANFPVKVGRMRDLKVDIEHRRAEHELREMGIELFRTFQANLIYFSDKEINLIQDVLDGIKEFEDRCMALPLHGDPQTDKEAQAVMADYLRSTWVPTQLTLLNEFRRILGVQSK